jgi:hypothetical protein
VAAGGARRLAGALFDMAAAGARSNTAKKLGNEAAEWATGQVVGQVVEAAVGSNQDISKVDYLRMASSGKPGVALANMAANMATDFLVDSAKKMYAGQSPATAQPSMSPLANSPLSSNISSNISSLLSAAGSNQGLNLPTTSFRDSVFNLTSNTIKPNPLLLSKSLMQQMQQSTVQQAFDVNNLLDLSKPKSFLPMAQKLAEKKEEKPQAAAEKGAAKTNEDVKEVSPTKNKM